MVEHVLHRDGQRVLIAQHHHPKRIADKDGIHTGLILCQRGGVIVGRQHTDRLTSLFLLTKGGGGHFLALRRGRIHSRSCKNGSNCRHGTLQ
jgi:hypothetical protein